MSDAEAELMLLLWDIRRRLFIQSRFASFISWRFTDRIYPTASYILKNVAELRLDGWKMTSPSVSADERRAESTDADHDPMILEQIVRQFLHDFDHYLREIMEPVISTGMDEHTSTLFLLEKLVRRYYVDSILKLILTSFAMGHGAWLLALKSIFADSSEQEDINMVLKRVVSLTSNLRGNPKTDAADCETGFCIYISLLSSTVRMPSDGWKSMESLYNLIRAMFEVTEAIRFLPIDPSGESILISLRNEFNDLLCVSLYWIVYGVTACSSQCNALPKNGVRRAQALPLDRNDMDLSISTTLEGKMLLLLISGLDISSNEILFLRDTYIKSKTSVQQDYEIVWVTILSGQWTTSSEEKYTKLLRMMSWYMVEHPNFISEKTKNFIRQVWKFKRRPIVVAIDKDGDVVYPNVIHMMYIWGSKAFPLTPLRERSLWNSAEARLDSLVFDFDPNMSRMMKFLRCLKMENGLSYTEETTSNGVESSPPKCAKYQSFSARDSGTDPILGDVKKLLSYKSAESWACLRTPSSDSMVHGLGDVM
uniref:Uncharacterized protein n=1 Tax=Kalanchoe fedtschenkoi TaxID=63787 RepID=A0A7N0T164_KALFE